MSDDLALPSLDAVAREWSETPKMGLPEFLERSKGRGEASGATLPAGALLRTTEPLPGNRMFLREVTFTTESVFIDASLANSRLYQCVLRGVQFAGKTHWTRARVIGCDLTGATFEGVDFTGTVFESTSLEGVDFTRATLRSTTFRNVTVDSKTRFTDAVVDGARFEQLALDQLAADALTQGQRKLIVVENRAADLLDGYWGSALKVQVFFLTLFLAPYLTFFIKMWATSQPCPGLPGVECSTPLEQFFGYVWFSVRGAFGLRLITGAICLAYNSLRFALIVKAFFVEKARRTLGAASDISFHDDVRWAKRMKLAKKLFKLNLVATLVHLLLWLLVPIVA